MSCLSYHEKNFKKKFILMSSGTWFVFFHPFIKKQNSDFYYSLNFDKKKITTFRYPGGILFKKFIKKNFYKEKKISLINKIISNNDFLSLNSKKNNKKYYYHLFMIYLTLKTYDLLMKLGNIKYPIIVDGIMSKNQLFLTMLSSLISKKKIYKSNDIHGVAKGMLLKKVVIKPNNYTVVKKDVELGKKLMQYYKINMVEFN